MGETQSQAEPQVATPVPPGRVTPPSSAADSANASAPKTPPAPASAAGAACVEATLISQLVQLVGQQPQHQLLLSDLGTLLSGLLRQDLKGSGGLRAWLRRYPALFRVTGQPGKESVSLLLNTSGSNPAADEGAEPAASAAEAERAQRRRQEDLNQSAVQLRGLPYRATVEDVKEFLGEHVRFLRDHDSVQLVLNRDGRASGFAKVQFVSPEAAIAARNELHRSVMAVAGAHSSVEQQVVQGSQDRYVEMFLFAERPNKLRFKRVIGERTSSGDEAAAAEEASGVTAEEVVDECRKHMALPGKGQLLLSMLGVALSQGARSFLKRTSQGLKHLLLQHPEEFFIGGPKGRETIEYRMAAPCSEEGHSAPPKLSDPLLCSSAEETSCGEAAIEGSLPGGAFDSQSTSEASSSEAANAHAEAAASHTEAPAEACAKAPAEAPANAAIEAPSQAAPGLVRMVTEESEVGQKAAETAASVADAPPMTPITPKEDDLLDSPRLFPTPSNWGTPQCVGLALVRQDADSEASSADLSPTFQSPAAETGGWQQWSLPATYWSRPMLLPLAGAAPAFAQAAAPAPKQPPSAAPPQGMPMAVACGMPMAATASSVPATTSSPSAMPAVITECLGVKVDGVHIAPLAWAMPAAAAEQPAHAPLQPFGASPAPPPPPSAAGTRPAASAVPPKAAAPPKLGAPPKPIGAQLPAGSPKPAGVPKPAGMPISAGVPKPVGPQRAAAPQRVAVKDAGPPTMLRLRGLPFESTVQDVLAFFAKHDVVDRVAEGPNAVHLVLRPNGKPSGQAHVRMTSRADAEYAVRVLKGKYMGNRYIEVFLRSEGEGSSSSSAGSSAAPGLGPSFAPAPLVPQRAAPAVREPAGASAAGSQAAGGSAPGLGPAFAPAPLVPQRAAPVVRELAVASAVGSQAAAGGELGSQNTWEALFDFLIPGGNDAGPRMGAAGPLPALSALRGPRPPKPLAAPVPKEWRLQAAAAS